MFSEQRVSRVLNSSYTMLTGKESTWNTGLADGLHSSWLFKDTLVNKGTWACLRHFLPLAGTEQNHKVRRRQPV